jgi:hypothetical protein
MKLPGEPRLDSMLIMGRDIEQVVDKERPRMIRNRFGNQFLISAVRSRDPGSSK